MTFPIPIPDSPAPLGLTPEFVGLFGRLLGASIGTITNKAGSQLASSKVFDPNG